MHLFENYQNIILFTCTLVHVIVHHLQILHSCKKSWLCFEASLSFSCLLWGQPSLSTAGATDQPKSLAAKASIPLYYCIRKIKYILNLYKIYI